MTITRCLALTAACAAFLATPALAADAKAPAKPTVKAAAAETTLTGRLACAMCVLKQKDVTTCTNVLVVPEAGKETIYAVTDNKVAQEYSMAACSHALPVKVTGKVSEKDGKKAITPSRIEKT